MWNVRGLRRVGSGWRRGVCSEAEVRVFWDLNRCGCGVMEVGEVQASRIAPNIVHALRSSGFLGPVSIHAYGNTRSLSNHHFLQSLLATGVDLHHVPGATKDLSNHLLVDLLLWMKENAPPAHLLLISGDKEYSSIMHKLHMRGYKILLAYPEGDISADLISSASRVWMWDTMMKGTEMAARTYEAGALPNMDTLLHSKCESTRSLKHTETQFSMSQDIQPRVELDVKSEKSFDSRKKPCNIPKKVVTQVIDIMRLKPSGFTVAAFRRQLSRSNIVLDKDFYGHRDLLSFLLSVPKLKANLVWTSDKTRTYLFTEDCTGSMNIDNESEETLSTRGDHDKEHEMAQVEEESKPSLGTRLESASALHQRQVDNRLAKITTMVEVSFDGNASKSPGILSFHNNAISTAWKKITSCFSSTANALQRVCLGAARPGFAPSGTVVVNNRIQSMPKDQDVETEPSISSGTSQSWTSEDGRKRASAKKVLPKEVPKGEESKVQEQVLHDDTKGKVSVNRSGVMENFHATEVPAAKQGKECGLHSGDAISSPFLQAGESVYLKESLKDPGLIHQLCEDVLSYMSKEGILCSPTREMAMEEVLMFLRENNSRTIARLGQEELVQLATVIQDKVVKQVQNHPECNWQYKAPTPAFNEETLHLEDKMRGLRREVEDDGFKALVDEEPVVSEEQDLRNDVPMLCEARDSSRMPSSDEMLPSRVNASFEGDVMLKDLKEMLQDSKSGVLLAAVKPLFKKRYGYDLNYKALGHPSLTSIISKLADLKLSKAGPGKYLVIWASEDFERTDNRLGQVENVNAEVVNHELMGSPSPPLL